jgi:hypothetical protein
MHWSILEWYAFIGTTVAFMLGVKLFWGMDGQSHQTASDSKKCRRRKHL